MSRQRGIGCALAAQAALADEAAALGEAAGGHGDEEHIRHQAHSTAMVLSIVLALSGIALGFLMYWERKSGKITYSWQNPGESQKREKLVLFRYLPEFEWIVASSSYLDEFYAPLRFRGTHNDRGILIAAGPPFRRNHRLVPEDPGRAGEIRPSGALGVRDVSVTVLAVRSSQNSSRGKSGASRASITIGGV